MLDPWVWGGGSGLRRAGGEGKGLAGLGLQGCVKDFRLDSKQNGKTVES